MNKAWRAAAAHGARGQRVPQLGQGRIPWRPLYCVEFSDAGSERLRAKRSVSLSRCGRLLSAVSAPSLLPCLGLGSVAVGNAECSDTPRTSRSADRSDPPVSLDNKPFLQPPPPPCARQGDASGGYCTLCRRGAASRRGNLPSARGPGWGMKPGCRNGRGVDLTRPSGRPSLTNVACINGRGQRPCRFDRKRATSADPRGWRPGRPNVDGKVGGGGELISR